MLRNVVLRTPLKEIAADMGLSERMVKYCKKKALEKMKKEMSANGVNKIVIICMQLAWNCIV